MGIKAKFTGLREMRRRVEHIRTTLVPPAAGAAAYGAVLSVMREAKIEAPDDTGDLAGSAYATLPVETSKGQVSEGGFGGKASGYAVSVHEKTERRYATGRPKYLEATINSRAGSLPKTVQAKFVNSLRRERGANQAADMRTSPGPRTRDG